MYPVIQTPVNMAKIMALNETPKKKLCNDKRIIPIDTNKIPIKPIHWGNSLAKTNAPTVTNYGAVPLIKG